MAEAEADDDYMPADPWLIRCRWLTDNHPDPGSTGPGSGNSSVANLALPDVDRKDSTHTSPVQQGATPEGSVAGSTAGSTKNRVYVYMEIQLYAIEADFYLVDFKCAGYKKLLYEPVDADEAHRPDERENLESRLAALDLRTAEGNAAGVRHLHKIGDKMRRKSGLGGGSGGGGRPKTPEEKVSSPFPFLDLASKLIIALAEGD